jgi:hypothetical protein
MHRAQGRESLHFDFFSLQRRHETRALILSAMRRALIIRIVSALLPDNGGTSIIGNLDDLEAKFNSYLRCRVKMLIIRIMRMVLKHGVLMFLTL